VFLNELCFPFQRKKKKELPVNPLFYPPQRSGRRRSRGIHGVA
jgi:hypothetical protein